MARSQPKKKLIRNSTIVRPVTPPQTLTWAEELAREDELLASETEPPAADDAEQSASPVLLLSTNEEIPDLPAKSATPKNSSPAAAQKSFRIPKKRPHVKQQDKLRITRTFVQAPEAPNRSVLDRLGPRTQPKKKRSRHSRTAQLKQQERKNFCVATRDTKLLAILERPGDPLTNAKEFNRQFVEKQIERRKRWLKASIPLDEQGFCRSPPSHTPLPTESHSAPPSPPLHTEPHSIGHRDWLANKAPPATTYKEHKEERNRVARNSVTSKGARKQIPTNADRMPTRPLKLPTNRLSVNQYWVRKLAERK